MILILIGIISIIIGIIGCIFPGIPGPPFSYLGLLLLHFGKQGGAFKTSFLILFLILTLIFSFIDYILPLLGTKVYGTSKKGMLFAAFGLIIGLLFFPPLGSIIGIFIGAVVGELLSGKKWNALKAGSVTFIANILAMIFKLFLSLIMTYFFIIKLLFH